MVVLLFMLKYNIKLKEMGCHV